MGTGKTKTINPAQIRGGVGNLKADLFVRGTVSRPIKIFLLLYSIFFIEMEQVRANTGDLEPLWVVEWCSPCEVGRQITLLQFMTTNHNIWWTFQRDYLHGRNAREMQHSPAKFRQNIHHLPSIAGTFLIVSQAKSNPFMAFWIAGFLTPISRNTIYIWEDRTEHAQQK